MTAAGYYERAPVGATGVDAWRRVLAGISLAEMIERYAADIPLGRVGDPADVAEVVAFLCSEPAIALVGQVLQPNGGTTR